MAMLAPKRSNKGHGRPSDCGHKVDFLPLAILPCLLLFQIAWVRFDANEAKKQDIASNAVFPGVPAVEPSRLAWTRAKPTHLWWNYRETRLRRWHRWLSCGDYSELTLAIEFGAHWKTSLKIHAIQVFLWNGWLTGELGVDVTTCRIRKAKNNRLTKKTFLHLTYEKNNPFIVEAIIRIT